MPEVAQVSGKVNAAIVFQNADLQQIASFPIVINVIANPSTGNKISNSYYKVASLDQLNAELDAMRALFGSVGALMLCIHQEEDGFVWDTPFNWEEIAAAVEAGRQVVVRDVSDGCIYTYYLLLTAEIEDRRLVFSRPLDTLKIATLWVNGGGSVTPGLVRLGNVTTVNGKSPDIHGNVQIDVGGDSVDLSNYCTKGEVGTKIGDISSALDHIIALQEELISL